MKKRGGLLLTAAGLMWLAAGAVRGQASATASTVGNARVLAAIRLTKTSDLSFGDLVPGATAGTVRVSTAGARTATGGVTLAGGTVSRARFTAQGERNKSYTITVPATVTVSSGANSMTVGTFVLNPTSPNTFPNGGSRNLNIGATLNVSANQPAGTYSNVFNVTVAYN